MASLLFAASRPPLSRECSCWTGEDLKSAPLNQARPQRGDARLAFAECRGARMDGVGAKDEVVPVRNGRADNKLGIGSSLELDGVVRRLEGRQIALSKVLGNRNG